MNVPRAGSLYRRGEWVYRIDRADERGVETTTLAAPPTFKEWLGLPDFWTVAAFVASARLERSAAR